MVLKIGISFNKISFNGVTIEKPYFKIDKKLNIEAKKIVITPQKTSSKTTNINKSIEKIFDYIKFVESIKIDNITYQDYNLSLLYNKELFTVENSDGKLTTKLNWINIGISFDIEELHYKKFNTKASGSGFIDPEREILYADIQYSSDLISGSININSTSKELVARLDKNSFRVFDENGTILGTLKADLENNNFEFIGEADFVDIKGSIEAKIENNIAKLRAKNASSKSLEKLAKILPVKDEIKDWIYGKIVADYYDIKNYYLEIDLADNYKTLLDSMKLDAYALNTAIKFHPEIPAAFGKKVLINIDNSTLDIDLENGEFENQNADVNLSITNLFYKNKVYLDLIVNSNALFDNSIRELIANYGIDLNIVQSSGTNKTTFTLGMDLTNYTTYTKTDTISKDATASLYIFDLNVSDLNLTTNNNHIYIPHLRSSHKFWKDSNLSAVIDSRKKDLHIYGKLKEFSVVNRMLVYTPLLDINITGKWHKDGIDFRSDRFASDLNVSQDSFSLNISDLSTLKNYIPAMQLLDINSGKFNLNYLDNQADANFSLNTSSPLLFTNGKALDEIHGTVHIDGSDFSIDILNRVVTIEQKNDSSTVLINNLEIDLFKVESFLKNRKELLVDNGNKNGSILATKFFIFGKNSTLKHKDKVVKNDRFSVNIDNSKLEAEFVNKNATLLISKRGDEIFYKGENIGKEWVNAITKAQMINGAWSITAMGNLNSSDHYGKIKIKNAQFKKARLITNVIAVINTIPALAQFRSPGFTADGFEIEDGTIEFYYANGTLFLNAVRLYGKNTDIIAQGSVDLRRNRVDIYASVQSVKSASKLIGDIPIFGYLLLGDSKRIENVLHITGTLDKPEVKSEAVKELLTYPIGVAKRIITLPAKIVE